jgi:hypothetical protein
MARRLVRGVPSHVQCNAPPVDWLAPIKVIKLPDTLLGPWIVLPTYLRYIWLRFMSPTDMARTEAGDNWPHGINLLLLFPSGLIPLLPSICSFAHIKMARDVIWCHSIVKSDPSCEWHRFHVSGQHRNNMVKVLGETFSYTFQKYYTCLLVKRGALTGYLEFKPASLNLFRTVWSEILAPVGVTRSFCNWQSWNGFEGL